MRNRLKGRITEFGETCMSIAPRIDRTADYLYKKIDNPRELKLSEVYTICDILEIDYEDIPEYFPPDWTKQV